MILQVIHGLSMLALNRALAACLIAAGVPLSGGVVLFSAFPFVSLISLISFSNMDIGQAPLDLGGLCGSIFGSSMTYSRRIFGRRTPSHSSLAAVSCHILHML